MVALGFAVGSPLFAMLEGSFLYFPSHAAPGSDLQAWRVESQELTARTQANPRIV